VRTVLGLLVVLALACVPASAVHASVKQRTPTAAAKKKACPVKRKRESKRARARRRACVARRKRAAREPLVAGVDAPAGATPAPGPGTAPAPAPGPAAAAPAGGAPAPAPVASTLGVDAFDFGSFVLRLTRPAVPAGPLTIYYRNRDVSEHNLWIDGPGLGGPLLVSGAIGEGATATKKLSVSAGSWRLFCSLPGHEAMSATLTVG
jgi:hypothetical protein